MTARLFLPWLMGIYIPYLVLTFQPLHLGETHQNMAGTLVTGPEPLQSWWLPGKEPRENGWAQKYENELRDPGSSNRRRRAETHPVSNKTRDRHELQVPEDEKSEVKENKEHGSRDRDVSVSTPLMSA
jgi:hypothetical protein